MQKHNGHKSNHTYEIPGRLSRRIDRLGAMHASKVVLCYRVIQRSVFGLTLAVLVTLLGIQTVQCVIKYMGKPTYFETDIVPQERADFPAITICPDSSQAYKSDVLKVLAKYIFLFPFP